MNRKVAFAIRSALGMSMVIPLVVHAQTASTVDAPAVEEVVVTGIRASIDQALEIKKRELGITEVISAEDIGKLPDKNVADALQRLPGVNVSSAAAGEGGFDENDRISIRGTSPSLTQTTVNGHAIANGDWFITDQFQTVGRSVSYTLLPSEIVSNVVVSKSQSADLLEGGVAGSVDIQTRRPLDLKQTFTASVQLAGERSDLADKNSPQANGLIAFRNDAGNFGVLAQAFYEERQLRRDGQEFLGYTTISGSSAAVKNADGSPGPYPALAGVVAPTLIGSALFEQTRKRKGGDIDIQLAPSDQLTVDLNGFFSRLDAENYNRNFMAFIGTYLNGNQSPTSAYPNGVAPLPGFTVKNGTLVAASFPATPASGPNGAGIPSVIVDDIYRPGAYAQTYYGDLNVKYQPTDSLTITAQLGYSAGIGDTPAQPAYEGQMYGGLSYDFSSGLGAPAVVSFPGVNPASFSGVSTSWGWNDVDIARDSEKYAKVDALLSIDRGIFKSVKVGARWAEHIRDVDFSQDAGCGSLCWSTVPAWNGATYPGNFGSGLNPPAGFLGNVWQLAPSDIAAYAAAAFNSGPAYYYWPGSFRVEEQDHALYGMVNLGGEHWAANVGVRLVGTYDASTVNVSSPVPTDGQQYCGGTPCAYNGFNRELITNQYWNVLPSASFKYDIDRNLVTRVSVAEAMARPDYSALGGAVSLTDLTLTGTGGNPNLAPIRSWNYDADIEWYFAPQSLLSVGLFYMDFKSYVDYGVVNATYADMSLSDAQGNRGVPEVYSITSPFNTKARDKGVEVNYQQAIWGGFGIQANYTYADGSTASGGELVGASKTTYNVAGYFEDKYLSARLAYTYRSHFLVGLDRSFAENEDDIGQLDASINFYITPHFKLNLDGLNLTNAELKYYANNTSQPRAMYVNGRQYYLGGTYKF